MDYLCNASKLTQILQSNSFENHEVIRVKTVSGGSINKTYSLQTNRGYLFLKVNNAKAFPGMFEAESKGLKLLAAHSNLHVPRPLLIACCGDDVLFFMSHLNPGSEYKNDYEFGTQLAAMHKTTNSQFGLNHDNYMGSLPQCNTFQNTWFDFFGQNRLQPQVKIARDSGAIPPETARVFDRFYCLMNDIFPEEPPALIHGDLWGGNYMFTQKGASIFDPAAAYAHREQDLAMTKLFGGFSTDFYRGYSDAFPVEKGFLERVDAYNLYPVLIHVNLFDGSYVRQLSEMLARYV